MIDYLNLPALGEMSVGDVAWTVPWALARAPSGAIMLRQDYPCIEEPGGTVTVKVVRIEAGYVVEFPAKEALSQTRMLMPTWWVEVFRFRRRAR